MATVTGMTVEKINAEMDQFLIDAVFDPTTGQATATKRDGEVISIGQAPTLHEILDASYPIGSIYFSAIATNPADLFGIGTWTAWGTGRVPVGVDPSQIEFNTTERVGGEKAHTLAATEMPKHTHTGPSHTHPIDHDHPSAATDSQGAHSHTLEVADNTGGASNVARGGTTNVVAGTSMINSAGAHTHNFDVPAFTGNSGSAGTGNTGSAGGDGAGNTAAHNNLQPYMTCYMWKRIS